MTGRKGIIGLSLLCALVFSAFGVANASAATHTTAFTCVPGGTGFKDAHCDESVATGGTFGHTPIAANTSTEIIGSNNTTASATSIWTLTGVIAGTNIKIHCANVSAMGTIENNTAAEGIKGTGTLETTNCTLTEPVSQVENCTVTVKNSETTSVSTGMGIKFSPKTGTIFTEITIANAAGKTCKGITGTFTVTGSATATGVGEAAETPTYSGATLRFTPSMAGLVFAGNAATLEGKLTLRMGPTATPGNPITATTVA